MSEPEPTPPPPAPRRKRFGWLSAPALVSMLGFGLVAGVVSTLLAQHLWGRAPVSSSVTLMVIVAGVLLSLGVLFALVKLIRKIMSQSWARLLASTKGLFRQIVDNGTDWRASLALLGKPENRQPVADAKALILGLAKSFLLTAAAGLGFTMAVSCFIFAQFLVTQLQTKRLEEQNRLLVAQNTVTADNQKFQQAQDLAESRYQEVQKILMDPKSPLPLQAFALREAPKVAALRVPKTVLTPTTDQEDQPTGQKVESVDSYPNAPRIRALLLGYMKMDRAGELLAKARADREAQDRAAWERRASSPAGISPGPPGRTAPLAEDPPEQTTLKADLEALKPLAPVSTELLMALHRMGSGQEDNSPQSLCLWNIPDNGEAGPGIQPAAHPEAALRVASSEEPVPIDLRHISPWDFSEAQGSYSFLGVSLHQARFPEKASLPRAQMQGADLSYMQMQGANFFQAQMQGANLLEAQLQSAFLMVAQMQGASLNEARMQGAHLSNAEMQGASLTGAQMQGASLIGAQMQGASLSGARMQGASLREARMQCAVLSKAQMQGASLFGAQMQGADFSEALLQGAVLSKARMQGADFSEALLQGASLSEAQLQGASLFLAQLQGADLRGAEAGGTRLTARVMKILGGPIGELEVAVPDAQGTEVLVPGLLLENPGLGTSDFFTLTIPEDTTDGKAVLARAREHEKAGKKLAEGLLALLTELAPLNREALQRNPFEGRYEADLKALLGEDQVKQVARNTTIAGMRLWSEDGAAYMDVETKKQFQALATQERDAARETAKNAQVVGVREKAEETAQAAERTLSDLEKVITDPAKIAERRKWNLLKAVKEAEAKAKAAAAQAPAAKPQP